MVYIASAVMRIILNIEHQFYLVYIYASNDDTICIQIFGSGICGSASYVHAVEQ